MERICDSRTLAVVVAALLIFLPGSSFARVDESGLKPLRFTYYLHDNFVPPNATSVKVASANGNVTNPGRVFGDIQVIDSPLREGIEKDSALIGHAGAQAAVLKDSFVFITFVHTYSFLNYTGSLSASGRFSVAIPTREYGISGGTGLFRGARGYFNVTTVVPDPLGFIIEYSASVFLPGWSR